MRIPIVDLECAFYLYPDKDSARLGRKIGGSGFWVSYPSNKINGFHWYYAVSNQHVVQSEAASVIRVNTKDGGVDFIDADPTEWTEHPKRHDIAVLPVANSIMQEIQATCVSIASFVSKTHMSDGLIGVGDDAYLIGRFINHDGRVRNTPSVRFGNVSMFPTEPIHISETRPAQESFAVELRSMCGYSGSPVFVQTGGWRKDFRGRWDIFSDGFGDMLLGVHWGHIIEPWTLETRIVQARNAGLQPEEREIDFVAANTGMNGVVPAWRLLELLDLPKFKEARESEEFAMIEKLRREIPGAKLDSAASPDLEGDARSASDENPTHREDFNRLLGAAARRPPQDDQT